VTEEKRKLIATSFITGLQELDPSVLNAIMTEDVVWNLPGSSLVFGEALGVGGIIERAKHSAALSLKIEILYVLFGRTGVACRCIIPAPTTDGRSTSI
jgi:hypothetical protein